MTSAHAHKRAPAPRPKNEFSTIALLLQGGGALGAYQAGVYEALHEAGVAPNQVGGISIGAINGAIIAGNKPADRVGKLRGFWEEITALPPWSLFPPFNAMVEAAGDFAENFWHQVNAGVSVTAGAPGFFSPRLVPPAFAPPGTPAATSYYDTTPLHATLAKFIDFDILNSGAVHYSTSAVNVHSGNNVVFETSKGKIRLEHVMASGALPPALPAVEIEGQFYWDGGLVSNTPLQWVMDGTQRDTLVFQVDLWSADGEFPHNIVEVATRQKEIQYSSRTRAITSRFKHVQRFRHAFAALYQKMPPELKNTAEARMLEEFSELHQYNIVHLIYHAKDYEGYSKDYEFSRATMEGHWAAGYNDTVHAMGHEEIFRKPEHCTGIAAFDFSRE